MMRRAAVSMCASSSSSSSSSSSRRGWWCVVVGVGMVDLDVGPTLDDLTKRELLPPRDPD